VHAHTFSAKKEGLDNISTLVDFNMPGAKEHATGKKVSGGETCKADQVSDLVFIYLFSLQCYIK